MCRFKIKFKTRLISTEKCVLTFHLSAIIRAQTRDSLRPLVRNVCLSKKNGAKETSFPRQKFFYQK